MTEDIIGETKNHVLAGRLVNMGLDDQNMRLEHQAGRTSFDSRVDEKNLIELKEMVQENGWPTISEVGPVASHAAWLIVQHADSDVGFQEKCLKLMRELKGGEIDKTNIAYLTDRVMVNSNKKQIYGTQFHKNNNGVIEPQPIKDMPNLDKRRKIMGLEPFNDYKSRMDGSYNYPEGYTEVKIGPFYKLR